MARAARKRLPAADLDPLELPEDGQQSVAQELVDPASVRVDRRTGCREEFIEYEDDVIRQATLRKLRELAQIKEHDGQGLLDADSIGFLQVHRLGAGAGRTQKPGNRHRMLRPDLTGEPDVLRRGDAGQRNCLGVGGRGKTVGTFVDAHAAGGATGATAAHGRMRDAVHAADLKQRRAGRNPYDRAADVPDRQFRPWC
jgi:hypothetical protein